MKDGGEKKKGKKKAISACGGMIRSLAGAAGDARPSSQMRSWESAGSVERGGSAALREARFVWKQRGGVSRSRLGCFRLRCPLLTSAIAVFNRNLPHLRVHPGSSLLLGKKEPGGRILPGAAAWLSAPTCAAPFP